MKEFPLQPMKEFSLQPMKEFSLQLATPRFVCTLQSVEMVDYSSFYLSVKPKIICIFAAEIIYQAGASTCFNDIISYNHYD